MRTERFFLVMSVFLATVVLASFMPSLYLRTLLMPMEGFRYRGALPLHLYLHGAVLTAWYLLLPTQALLATRGRTDWHRKTGVIGVAIATAMVPTAFLAVARAPRADEVTAAGMNPDLASIASFAVCVGLAIAARARPPEHKRLMLIASIAPIPFALARVEIVAANAGLRLPASFSVATALLLLAAIPLYDMVTLRRPHAGTLKGLITVFVASPLLTAGFVASGLHAWLAELVS